MRSILYMLMTAVLVFATAGPVLASVGDLELRVTEHMGKAVPTHTMESKATPPVIIEGPLYDLTIFDQFGRFEGPRVK